MNRNYGPLEFQWQLPLLLLGVGPSSKILYHDYLANLSPKLSANTGAIAEAALDSVFRSCDLTSMIRVALLKGALYTRCVSKKREREGERNQKWHRNPLPRLPRTSFLLRQDWSIRSTSAKGFQPFKQLFFSISCQVQAESLWHILSTGVILHISNHQPFLSRCFHAPNSEERSSQLEFPPRVPLPPKRNPGNKWPPWAPGPGPCEPPGPPGPECPECPGCPGCAEYPECPGAPSPFDHPFAGSGVRWACAVRQGGASAGAAAGAALKPLGRPAEVPLPFP